MTSASVFRCHLAIIVLFLLSSHSATAFKFSKAKASSVESIEKQAEATPNAELMALVRPFPEDPDGVYIHALEILAAMKTSPSCNRLALSSLLDSCQSIDGSEHDSEASIEDSRSLYAAQLAICEIGRAGLPTPQSCDSLTTVIKGNSKAAPRTRKDGLSGCLQSLHSRPQSWISYSNNKQNAGILCQAAQQFLKLHKSMVETSAEASDALGRITKEAMFAMDQAKHDFSLARKRSQEDFQRDLEASIGKAESVWERVVNQVSAKLQTLFSAIREAHSDTAGLTHNIHQANGDAIDLQENVGKARKELMEGTAQLGAIQAQQLGSSRELLWETTEGARFIHGVISSLSEIAENTTTSVNAMRISVHITQGELQNMSSIANGLKASLNDMAATVGLIASLPTVAGWIPAISFGVLVLYVLYLVRPAYAPYYRATFIILFCAYNCGIVHILKSTTSNIASIRPTLQRTLPQVAIAVCLAISLVSVIAYNIIDRCKTRASHKAADASNLPFYEKLFAKNTPQTDES